MENNINLQPHPSRVSCLIVASVQFSLLCRPRCRPLALNKQILEKISLNSKFRENLTLPLLFRYILLRHSRVVQTACCVSGIFVRRYKSVLPCNVFFFGQSFAVSQSGIYHLRSIGNHNQQVIVCI